MALMVMVLMGLALFLAVMFMLVKLYDRLKKYCDREEYEDEWVEESESEKEEERSWSRVPQPQAQQETPAGHSCLRWTHNIIYPKLSSSFQQYLIPAGSFCSPTPAATSAATPTDTTHVVAAPEFTPVPVAPPESSSASSAPPMYSICSTISCQPSPSLPNPLSPSETPTPTLTLPTPFPSIPRLVSSSQAPTPTLAPLSPPLPRRTLTLPPRAASTTSVTFSNGSMTPLRHCRVLRRATTPGQESPSLERLRQAKNRAWVSSVTLQVPCFPEGEAAIFPAVNCAGCEQGFRIMQKLVEQMDGSACSERPSSPRETTVTVEANEVETAGKTTEGKEGERRG